MVIDQITRKLLFFFFFCILRIHEFLTWKCSTCFVCKIATKYLLPELAGARLTPKLCSRVAEAFVSKYGEYAGWAQTLLFIADLPSQKALLPSHFWDIKEKKSAKIEDSNSCNIDGNYS